MNFIKNILNDGYIKLQIDSAEGEYARCDYVDFDLKSVDIHLSRFPIDTRISDIIKVYFDGKIEIDYNARKSLTSEKFSVFYHADEKYYNKYIEYYGLDKTKCDELFYR